MFFFFNFCIKLCVHRFRLLAVFFFVSLLRWLERPKTYTHSHSKIQKQTRRRRRRCELTFLINFCNRFYQQIHLSHFSLRVITHKQSIFLHDGNTNYPHNNKNYLKKKRRRSLFHYFVVVFVFLLFDAKEKKKRRKKEKATLPCSSEHPLL